MHRSGAQSVSDVHTFEHAPGVSPLHVWAPPQFSFDTQPQVPPLQIPLAQSAFVTQGAT